MANDTALPRLVLIVDVWHPQLSSHAQRLAILRAALVDPDGLTAVYEGVVRKGLYLNTTQRGH